jgi:hypothetical protein
MIHFLRLLRHYALLISQLALLVFGDSNSTY